MLVLPLPVHAQSIDVNRATADELQTLRGIGPAMAARIIAERERQPFRSLDDLARRVRGVGARRLQQWQVAGLVLSGTKPGGTARSRQVLHAPRTRAGGPGESVEIIRGRPVLRAAPGRGSAALAAGRSKASRSDTMNGQTGQLAAAPARAGRSARRPARAQGGQRLATGPHAAGRRAAVGADCAGHDAVSRHHHGRRGQGGRRARSKAPPLFEQRPLFDCRSLFDRQSHLE